MVTVSSENTDFFSDFSLLSFLAPVHTSTFSRLISIYFRKELRELILKIKPIGDHLFLLILTTLFFFLLVNGYC